jgi:Zn-dependent peptidase ImmA (M78 family)/DNA-binding XRE family transcriptional regulator
MIYGERIKQARELRGLNQTDLASLIGCKQSAIAHFETNRTLPSSDTLKNIARVTGFMDSFFETPPIEGITNGSLAYRSKRSLTKKEEAQAYQYAAIMYEQAKKLIQKCNIPVTRMPKISEKPSLSARVSRAALGISPDKPIHNLTHHFEQNGGMAFIAPFIFSKIDAFSTWAVFDIDRPMIVVSSGIPGDRMRYSIAHEIGHLIMHNPPKTKKGVIELEKEANAFASEFLMPKDVIKKDLIPPITLTSLMKLKQKWGVSLQALIYRAYELGLITERHYHYLFEQLSIKGWRKREPIELDVPIEYPKAFNTMLEVVYSSSSDYALDMKLDPIKAREFTAFY